MDHEKSEVVYKDDKYAKKGLANTALGFGIAGTVLGVGALMKKGGLYGAGACAPCAPYAGGCCYGGLAGEAGFLYLDAQERCDARKECEDVLMLEKELGCLGLNLQDKIYRGDFKVEVDSLKGDFMLERQIGETKSCLEKEIFGLALKGQKELCNTQHHLEHEIWGLDKQESVDICKVYRNMDAVAFHAYKEAKEGDAKLEKRLCELEKREAVLEAVTPLKDALLKKDILAVAREARHELKEALCGVLRGTLIAPTTPLISGVAANASCCSQVLAATASE
jgi:hypothetical protein